MNSKLAQSKDVSLGINYPGEKIPAPPDVN